MKRMLVLATVLSTTACRTEGHSTARTGVDAATPPGLAEFAYGDFGSLSRAGLDRAAIPWKVAVVGLLQRAERARGHALSVDSLPELLREYGFLDPRRIANWIGPTPRVLPPALGLVTATVPLGIPGLRVSAAGIGCAACHSGTTYDAAGHPTGQAWVGLPSTAIALDAYADDIFRALDDALAHPEQLLARVQREFPETGFAERFTLRHLVVPRGRKRLDALRSAGNGPLPFRAGPPGHSNGQAALKYYLRPGDPSIDWRQETGFVGVPDLSARHLRSALLIDGVYAPHGTGRFIERSGSPAASAAHLDALAPVAAFVVVPAMGVPPERAVKEVPHVRQILDWLSGFRTPPFPGRVDSALAAEGAKLFTRDCAVCHGTYADTGAFPRPALTYPNRLVPLHRIGTDSMRAVLVDDATRVAFERTPFARFIDAERTDGYVAPMLSGIWATAPYLHNGSVPTVWDLLTPDARPDRFMLGGHALDYEKLGVALVRSDDGLWRYPSGYAAWSRMAVYDTRAPAHDNSGHRYPATGLTTEEKRRIIEYLKSL